MLKLTARAHAVIQRITGHPALDAESGVRIARPDVESDALGVEAVDGPSDGDRVVEKDGARLYLGPESTEKVDGRKLDARTDPEGRVEFVLRED